ncbi:TIGR02452 family protein [Pelomyxa schiedti]|nr:TIGR02452 family protein [Pelomyxa schiedti]
MTTRKGARLMAEETVRVLKSGEYTTGSGTHVVVREDLERAITGTVCHLPEDPILTSAPRHFYTSTRVSVIQATTLQAIQGLVSQGVVTGVSALNFASAKHPGGGFLKGSRAQEESLSRSSGLYACLTAPAASPLYKFNEHRKPNTGLYSDHVTYSPGTPVFRDEDGTLKEHPHCVSFITSPAVNAGVVYKRVTPKAQAEETLRPVMMHRAHRVLCTAVAHGDDVIILGAWGCGVFKNDPKTVAELFCEQLLQPISVSAVTPSTETNSTTPTDTQGTEPTTTTTATTATPLTPPTPTPAPEPSLPEPVATSQTVTGNSSEPPSTTSASATTSEAAPRLINAFRHVVFALTDPKVYESFWNTISSRFPDCTNTLS